MRLQDHTKLLSFKPDYVDAYINMGHVLKGQTVDQL